MSNWWITRPKGSTRCDHCGEPPGDFIAYQRTEGRVLCRCCAEEELVWADAQMAQAAKKDPFVKRHPRRKVIA